MILATLVALSEKLITLVISSSLEDCDEDSKWLTDLGVKYLYHATYKPLLDIIKQDSIIKTSPPQHYWDFSKNYIYLAKDPDLAASYAESSEVVPQEYLDQIAVLKIRVDDLDQNYIEVDKNQLYDNVKNIEDPYT